MNHVVGGVLRRNTLLPSFDETDPVHRRTATGGLAEQVEHFALRRRVVRWAKHARERDQP